MGPVLRMPTLILNLKSLQLLPNPALPAAPISKPDFYMQTSQRGGKKTPHFTEFYFEHRNLTGAWHNGSICYPLPFNTIDLMWAKVYVSAARFSIQHLLVAWEAGGWPKPLEPSTTIRPRISSHCAYLWSEPADGLMSTFPIKKTQPDWHLLTRWLTIQMAD